MSTEPDPQMVREIARKWLLDPDLGAEELDYAVRSHVGYGMPDDEFQEWRAAVDEAAQDATKTTTVSWPDEQAQAERDVLADEQLITNVREQRMRDFVNVYAAVFDREAPAFRDDFLTVLDENGRLRARVAALDARTTDGGTT